MRLSYPMPLLCQMLSISRSCYYTWKQRPLSRRTLEDTGFEVKIKAAHRRSREVYGLDRLQKNLAEHRVQIGVHPIKQLRRELGLPCKQKRKFRATTNSAHSLPVADNLLVQDITATVPNQVWLTDITSIATDEGWLYLAEQKDMYANEIIGYAMSNRMTKNLVSKSLFQAVATKRPPVGLIHYSDRGDQYCPYEYSKLLKQFEMQSSMNGKGNCHDNAPTESFWGTLKTELVFHQHYQSRQEAIQAITEYIDFFYKRQRIQKKLEYLPPVAFECQFYKMQKIA